MDETHDGERVSGYGTLYLVATPIGNLGDFSPRAADILRSVDLIAAEDTRVTRKLLSHLQIGAPMVSYHEHNKASAGDALLRRLLDGADIALVTDAGTPGISDPGEDLVRLCGDHGVETIGIPGCCAAVDALSLSGLPTGRWCFEGFLPVDKKIRRERLASLAAEERTMVFHEAPHKLRGTLDDLCAAFGPGRRIALCRELTKIHEETVRTTLGEAAEAYREREPRGEYVLVVAGAEASKGTAVSMEDAVAEVRSLRADGVRLKDAVRDVAERYGLRRNELYAASLREDGDV